ncbi:MAG TPA: Sec-dependent nitrous-oxide reductase [Nitriliruptorales bacterium]
MLRSPRFAIGIALVIGLVLGVVGAQLGLGSTGTASLSRIAEQRGLDGNEAEAALMTYTAPGTHDEYYLVASGGHSGQIHIVGVPSMRLLKTVPVFTAESWSGYGFGADWSEELLSSTAPGKDRMSWGDSHHPALSETNGDYDGRFVYINDRANGRLGFVDLRDFKTKQILDIPNIQTSHGGVFATPDTEYVHISAMTPAPIWAEDGYAALEDYEQDYRGVSTFVSIDQETGKGDLSKSFQIELPPYDQDLADAGKLASDGYAFINSYNTEMAWGEDGVPKETGSITNDFDFMHVINWRRAAEVVEEGNYETLNGVRIIRLDTAIEEGLLHFVPEPRNPHGVDVSPSGEYLTVAGKLDPAASVYSITKIKAAIESEDFEGHDPFGVPILNLDSVREAHVELGGGPLHTQYDNEGHAYTSLFVESAVAKWSLGPAEGKDGDDAWKLVEKIPIHYNVGHLVTAHGDTVAPHGKYAVALNKWSVDRFPKVGTLLPQNFQLIDLASDEMRVLVDMPIGFGEPHYVQMVKADLFADSWQTYPEPGTDPLTMTRSEHAIASGEERIEREADGLHVYMSASRSHFTPDIIRAEQGEQVHIHLTNIETALDATHGFAIPGYDKQVSIDPGETVTIELTAEKTGSFAFYCTEFCSALHLEMQGWMLVEP